MGTGERDIHKTQILVSCSFERLQKYNILRRRQLLKQLNSPPLTILTDSISANSHLMAATTQSVMEKELISMSWTQEYSMNMRSLVTVQRLVGMTQWMSIMERI